MSLERVLKKKVFWESTLLCALCLGDAAMTILLVVQGRAVEGNPVMAYYFRAGVLPFVFTKVLILLLGVSACEALHFKNPLFARAALRFASVGYGLVYALGVAGLNHPR